MADSERQEENESHLYAFADEKCIYEIYDVPKDATPSQIKKQYHALALKYHPDRHAGKSPEEITDVKEKFQQTALIYAVLSDPARRARYDATGALDDADADADMPRDAASFAAYFAAIHEAAVTPETIEAFAKTYRLSDEERDDVIEAYRTHEGNMDLVFEHVLCCDAQVDQERFAEIIDKAIKDGHVVAYKAYTSENSESRAARARAALDEAQEAEEMLEQMRKRGESITTASDLALVLKKRQMARAEGAEGFLDDLVAKYTTKPRIPASPKPTKASKSSKAQSPRRSARLSSTPAATAAKRKATTASKAKRARKS